MKLIISVFALRYVTEFTVFRRYTDNSLTKTQSFSFEEIHSWIPFISHVCSAWYLKNITRNIVRNQFQINHIDLIHNCTIVQNIYSHLIEIRIIILILCMLAINCMAMYATFSHGVNSLIKTFLES